MRNKNRLLHRKANAKLPQLIIQSNGKCHWCSCEIIQLKEVQKKFKIIRKSESTITFIYNDQPKTIDLATTDHIKAVSHGGTNDMQNLVASCWSCNQLRGKLFVHALTAKKKFKRTPWETHLILKKSIDRDEEYHRNKDQRELSDKKNKLREELNKY